MREAPPPQGPPPPPRPPALPRRVAAFAFVANEETTAPYVEVVQGGANFLYDASRGYGYADVDGLDGSPNNRNVLSPADEIYDQLIGAKPPGADVVFRVDVPNGTYRFVAAGGDPQYTNHATTVRARNGHSGDVASLVEDFPNPNGEYWRVGFEGREPPPAAVAFAPLADSPTLVVTQGFVELCQIAAEVEGAGAGGDLNFVGTNLRENPSFAKLAEDKGAHGFRNEDPQEVGDVVKQAISSRVSPP